MKHFPPRSDTLVSNLCETPSPRRPTFADKLANRMTPDRAMHSRQAPCTASMLQTLQSRLIQARQPGLLVRYSMDNHVRHGFGAEKHLVHPAARNGQKQLLAGQNDTRVKVSDLW